MLGPKFFSYAIRDVRIMALRIHYHMDLFITQIAYADDKMGIIVCKNVYELHIEVDKLLALPGYQSYV